MECARWISVVMRVTLYEHASIFTNLKFKIRTRSNCDNGWSTRRRKGGLKISMNYIHGRPLKNEQTSSSRIRTDEAVGSGREANDRNRRGRGTVWNYDVPYKIDTCYCVKVFLKTHAQTGKLPGHLKTPCSSVVWMTKSEITYI